MIVIFESGKKADLFNSIKKLTKEFGDKRAKLIRKRLDDLSAAPNLEAMRFLPGRCHELHGNRQKTLALDLDGGWRLIFESSDEPLPLKTDGGLDWRRVQTVKILRVEDYH
ncbi:MAG: killer suppression protein HigA [Chloroherpetonaceae bacterium]|nr:killer suppression protein HigA [Chloroherpetonaceae bacterium]